MAFHLEVEAACFLEGVVGVAFHSAEVVGAV